MVFLHDNWELDTQKGTISTGGSNGKIIAEVFGATDFNPDNEQAMSYAKVIQAAPKMFNALQALTLLFENLQFQCNEISAVMKTAKETINQVQE